MSWLRGPPLLVACYDNKIADVRKLLASGADPQAAAPSYDERSPTRPSHSSCIFSCIHKWYFEVLEALLATGQYDLVHQVQNTMVPCSIPPLMAFAAGVVARHAEGEPIGPREKRMNEIVCECAGDLREAAARLRAEPLPPDPRTGDEKWEEYREWFTKKTGVRLGTD